MVTYKILSRPKDKLKRRFLRNHMPEAEIILWSKLQRRQQLGYRFLRQYSVGIFVIDFYCPKLKLAIEIDGSSHLGEQAKSSDKDREIAMMNHNIQIIRFTNKQIFHDLKNVVLEIRKKIMRIENDILNAKDFVNIH